MRSPAAGTARRRFLFGAAVALAAMVMLMGASFAEPVAGAPPASPENLILNPQFIKGAGNFPDHWRTEGWDQKPDVTNYRWHHEEEDRPGEVEIDSSKPNDARWMQSLNLSAGWYYFSVDARTENVGSNEAGATLSIMEDGITSQELKGTNNWTRIGLYLKVGHLGADVEMALRLGGYSSLNTGHAFFRDVSLIRVQNAPKGAEHTYDLEATRKAAQPQPIGRPWTLVAVFILLGGAAVYGWQLFGEATLRPARPVAAPSPPPPPPPKPAEKPKPERPRDEPPKEERKPVRGKKKQRKRK